MSHLHFTAAEPYRNRVIQLGESPERVFNVGAIGLDNLTKLELIDRTDLEKALDFKLDDSPVILCTYHPETLMNDDSGTALQGLFKALDDLKDAKIVLTKGNADTNGRKNNQRIDDYASKNPGRVFSFTSLGQLNYLSLLREADIVIGNSSSGIIEAPVVGTPTVNIGNRQQGRLKAPSIIDCDASFESISSALEKALSPEFREIAARRNSLFGQGGASEQIKHVLKTTALEGILIKRFHDLETAEGDTK
jgi:UDP-N-acetylglucosamine 2-epimerase (non-hydrolysing)/GDP/UDP-N,N'-diacetylbacillosamine 2-epimerase (hydrolysing)